MCDYAEYKNKSKRVRKRYFISWWVVKATTRMPPTHILSEQHTAPTHTLPVSTGREFREIIVKDNIGKIPAQSELGPSLSLMRLSPVCKSFTFPERDESCVNNHESMRNNSDGD